MAEKLFPTRHKTLGELYDAGLHLRAFCMNDHCRWSAALDLDDLIERLGRRHGTMPADLVPVLVCSQCGGKDVAVTLSAANPKADVPEETAAHIRENWKAGEPEAKQS